MHVVIFAGFGTLPFTFSLGRFVSLMASQHCPRALVCVHASFRERSAVPVAGGGAKATALLSPCGNTQDSDTCVCTGRKSW